MLHVETREGFKNARRVLKLYNQRKIPKGIYEINYTRYITVSNNC